MRKILVPALGLSLLAIAVAIFFGFRSRQQAQQHFQEKVIAMEAKKNAFVELYVKRGQLLIDWEAKVRRLVREKDFPASLELSEALRQAGALQVTTGAEVERFDFIQNQISQKIGDYLTSPVAQKVRPPELERLEEAINRGRRAYHEDAFEADRLRRKFWLKEAPPMIFPAEKLLKEKNLY